MCFFSLECGQIAKGFDPGKKKVSSTPYGRECRQAGDLLPDRTLGDLELQRAILRADDWIVLVAEFMKIRIVDPHVLRELKLANETGTTHKGGNASLHAVLGRAFRQFWTVGTPATYHPAPVHVRSGVTRIHAPNVRAEWNGITVRIHLPVIEVVIALRVRAERRIIVIRRQNERSAAAPASHQLRRD